jgi:hypothetical protein
MNATATLNPTAWTVDNGVRVVGNVAEDKPAHPAYLTVSADDIAPKLAEAGFRVKVAQSQFTGPGRAILTVEPLNPYGSYMGQCHILLDHRGKGSVKLRGGTLRHVCQNEFFMPAFALHHCHRAIRNFVEDPTELVRHVLEDAQELPGRIESLRGKGRVDWLMDAFRASRPRLAKQAERFVDRYVNRGMHPSPDAWAFVQGLTATRVRGRRPAAFSEIASRVVRLPEAVLCGDQPIVPGVFDTVSFN